MNIINKNLIYFLIKTIQYFFEVSFLVMIILFFMEYFKEGIVTNYFNFNLLWLVILLLAITLAVLPIPSAIKPKKRILTSLFFGIAGGFIIYFIYPEAVFPASVVAFFGAIAVYLSFNQIFTATSK